MSAAYVRMYYGVPARKGMRVTVDSRPGVITSFPGAYIAVLFDGARRAVPAHPTWRVTYQTEETTQ